MDDLISIFFENKFTEEQRILNYKALGLLNAFGYTGVHQALIETIMREGDEHDDNIVDQVHLLIEEGIDKLIFAHRITLEGEPRMSFKVNLMEALYGLSYREDYQPYELVLEDWTSTDEQKLAYIISDITGMEESDILEHLTWVYPGTMKRLEELIQSKVQEQKVSENLEELKQIRKNLLIFQTAFSTPPALAGLIELDPAKGSKFDTYLSLFSDEVIDAGNLEDTTWRLLWLALISSDGTQNPQKLLLEKAPDIFPEAVTMNRFTSMVQKAMGHYQEFKAQYQ